MRGLSVTGVGRREGRQVKLQSRLRFETLEPRLLLSAQVLHVDPSHLGGDWAVQIDAATHSVQILDQQKGDAVVQQYSAPATGSVEIDAAKNDHLTVEIASLPATVGAPNLNWIMLSGQAGDTLASSGGEDHWVVDAQGGGTLDGLKFAGFTKLEDASGSNDTFAWEPNGPLAMSIVGAGSSDALSIQGNGFQKVGVTTSGPQSGSVSIDGSTLDFSGLDAISIDPLDAEKEVVANVTVTAPSPNDDLVLKTATNDAQLTFESLKNRSPSITFFKPSESLTVDATGGDDTVSVNPLSLSGASLTVNTPLGSNTVNLGSISTGGGALTVNNGPTGPQVVVFSLEDDVDVDPGATLSTRGLNASGAVKGDSGAITLEGTDIDLGIGSSLNASAGGAFKAGDVTLAANYQVIATGFVLDNVTNNFVPRSASITVGANATIDGGTVDLGATAGDQSVNGLVNGESGGFNFMKPLENFASFLSLPVSVLGKASDAEIDIGQDAAIDATGALNVDATAQSLATGNAIYWFSAGPANAGGVAVVYDETDATANISIATGAQLVAGGDVSVISDATSKATGIARVSQNTGLFPTNPQNVQVSVAVGLASIVSHVNMAEGAEITSGGNIAVQALGVSGNSQSAETASYGDGLVGIDGTLVFTNNDVKATVNGTIVAKGAPVPPTFTFNPSSAVNSSTGVFNLGNVAGIQTGDAFTYSSGLGGAIGGLTNGQVYYAIRIPANSTSIELAATAADALAGKAIKLQPDPTITTVEGGQTYQFTNVDETNNAIDLGQNWMGSGVAPKVVYHAAPGQQVGGLVDGNTYIALPVAGDPTEIQLVDPSAGQIPVLDINPTVTTTDGQSFDFSVNETPDDLIFTSAPGFAKGQALVYHQALGLQIGGLVDGQTYYAIPVPNEDGSPGIDPTLFRLAATEADALASDGYTNVIDISTDDSSYQSGDAHTLTPVAVTGIDVSASLTSFDKAITKSGIGSEPKLRDAITKGELAPAFTSILSNLGNIFTPGKTNPIESKIKNNTPAGSGSNTNFTLSAALAFLTADNNVTAEIGSDAVLQSGTNVSVTATISHKIQTAAEGRISKGGDSGSTFAVGGAADITIDTDNAQAMVDSGAQIDAARAIAVTSDVEFPFLVALGSPDEYGQSLLDKLKTDPQGTIGSFVGRTLFIQDQFVNAWTRATGKNPNGSVSVAGSVDFEDYTTTSKAIISGGALINQDPALQNPAQSVAVTALTNLNRVDVTGIFDIELSPDGLAKARRKSDALAIYEPMGSQGATGGLGGAFNIIDYNTTTTAEIGDGAKVTAGADGSVSVGSSQNILAIELLQSGAKGGTFGVSGALDYFTDTSDTEAWIGSGATISAPAVNVDAVDQSFLFSLTGSVVSGGSVGFGVSATVIDVNRTTLAYIGDPTGASDEASNINLGPDGTLSIQATTTGTVVALSVSGATAGSDSTPSGGQNTLPTPNAGQGAPGASTGSFGLAVSGAVSFTSVDEITKAFIDDSGTIQAGSVDVAALDDSLELSAAGSAAISAGGDGSTNIGLAGAYGEIDLTGETQAYVNRATLSVSGNLNVTANRTGHAFSLVAGGSGSSRNSGIAVTGSAAVNRMSQDTSVLLDNAKITAGGNVNLTSVDALSLSVVAGALSFGGRFGFGASVAYNYVDSSVRARIANSAVTAPGVSVKAARGDGDAENPTPQIIAVAGSLGAGASGAAAAGTVAVNFIEPNANGQGVEALVENSNVAVTGSTPLAITADGQQGIVVIAGGVVASKQAGFGVAVAYNEITAPVTSLVNGGTINAAGGVQITADSASRISSVALGVVIAGQSAAAAGSASANIIEQPIEAAIRGGAKVNSKGAVNVSATETSAIDGAAGSAAFAPQSAAFGAAIVTNTLANATTATIDGSRVSANAVTVEALSTQDQITAVAAGGEGSKSFAAGASVAVNTIRNTTAALLENGAVIVEAQDVEIHAGESGNTYTASAGAIAAAKSAAIGAAAATNDIATTVQAEVIGANTITDPDVGQVTVNADREDALNLALAVGGAGAETFALGGSVAIEKDRSNILAEAAGGASLGALGDVSLVAEDRNNANSVTAGSVAGAKTAAIGAAVATADLAPTIRARVAGGGPGRTVDGPENFEVMAQQTGDSTLVLAVGGAGAQNFAAGASAATVLSRGVIEASVDAGSRVVAGSISVTAQQTQNKIDTAGGGVAGAQSAAIGAAVVVNDLADVVEAQISGTASAHYAISVAADVNSNTSRAIAVSGAGAQTFALGGSVAVTKLGGTTEALIADGAPVATAGSISVSANRVTNAQTIGGAIAGAGTAAFGIGNATLLSTEQTLATVGNAVISAGGGGAGLSVKTGVDGEIVSVDAFKGLSLTATAEDDLLTLAAGGAGAGTAAIAGSAAVTQMDETTNATLGAKNPAASNFNVFASNVTNSTSGGGSLGGAGTVGVGAGADAATIEKTTEAKILSTTLQASGNVYLQALSQESLTSFAGSASFAGQLSLAGAASVFVLDLTTQALVGDGVSAAGVSANGNVLIAANDKTTLNQFAGTVSASGLGTVGASAAVATVTKTTEALVAAGSSVTARANPGVDAISAALGTFDVTYAPPSGSPDDVQPPNVQVDLGSRTGDPSRGELNDPALTQERQANEEYGSTRGVAITAVNQDEIKSFDIGAGASPGVAISLAAGVDVANVTTLATIADGAIVTAGQGASTPGEGSVDVIASDDFSNLGLAGALAISGKFGASPGVDSSIVGLTTKAQIGFAIVSASRDVIVEAKASEDILSITGGLAASGLVALSAGAGVVDIEDQTLAEIGVSGQVNAGGNVGVLASDETKVVNVVGQAAVGIGAAGIGASAAVTLVNKDTEAAISANAVVNASADGPNTIVVPTGGGFGSSPVYPTKNIKGVAVESNSSEDVTAVAVSGAGGLLAGVGGGATYTVVDATTHTTIGSARVTAGSLASPGGKSISVGAVDAVQVLDVGGGFAVGGGAGIGGGVDVGIIRNDTATIVNGAQLAAAGDIDVLALSYQGVTSYAVSGGGGAIGVAGAVSVWTLGGTFASSYKTDSGSSTNALSVYGGSSTSALGYADRQTDRTDVLDLLGSYKSLASAPGSDNTSLVNAIAASAAGDLKASQPNGVVEKEAASARQTGTRASVAAGASITAGGSILIASGQTIRTNITAGGGAIGIVGVGGSVGILNVNEHTSVNFDGVASAGGDLLVSAATSASENVNAYGGQAGLVAAGAQVALLSDTGTVSADMGPDAKVERAGLVTLRALRNFDSAHANAKGGAVGGLAAGAAVANITIGGSAEATVAGSTIGAASGSQVRDLLVQARFSADATADTIAVAAGVGSGVGNVSTVTLNPTVSAIAEGVDGKGLIGLTGDLTVDADSTAIGHAIGEGRAYGGIGVGVNNTTATTTATTDSLLQDGISVSTRNVSVTAHSNDVADASGQANAGGSLIGVTSATSTATDTSTTLAQILKTQPVNASGNVTVSATNDKSDATAVARGINAPGLAIGVSTANATANPTVLAGVTDANVTAGGNVSITAKFGSSSMAGASAEAYGSVGALPAGTSLTANSSANENVRVFAALGYFSSPSQVTTSQITAGGNVTIGADSTTKSSATSNNTGNGFFFATGDTKATATSTDDAPVTIGSGAKIKAGKALTITTDLADTVNFGASGASGGTIPLGSAASNGSLNRSTNVSIGNNVTLEADTISLLATVRSTTVTGNASWESKGLGGNAFPRANFTLQGNGPAVFVGRAVVTARVVTINATDNENIRVNAYGDVQGLGGRIEGDATITNTEMVAVRVDPNATITGTEKVVMNAGYGQLLDLTHVQEYLGAFAGDMFVTSTVDLRGSVFVGPTSGTNRANIVTPSFQHSVTPSTSRNVNATYERSGTPFRGGTITNRTNDARSIQDAYPPSALADGEGDDTEADAASALASGDVGGPTAVVTAY